MIALLLVPPAPPHVSVADRIARERFSIDQIEENLSHWGPETLKRWANSYRDSAVITAQEAVGQNDYHTRLVLLALAGTYATRSLIYEAALKERGLA